MKIIIVVVCFWLIAASKANYSNEIESSVDKASDAIITKIKEGLSLVKSEKCKSDLNFTVSAFLERQPWAAASKIEFRSGIDSLMNVVISYAEGNAKKFTSDD